jgi:hypothetical protein
MLARWLSLPFRLESNWAPATGTSASGRRQRRADSRGHTLKAWPSSTGRTMARGSPTIRLDPETRYLSQTQTGDRRVQPSSLRLPGSTVTFHCRHPTRHSSTSYMVPYRTNLTSGASPVAMGRVSHPVLLDRRTMMYLASDPIARALAFIAWTSSAAFPIG